MVDYRYVLFHNLKYHIEIAQQFNRKNQFKGWFEKPTKDLQIANMYRRLQKTVIRTILSLKKSSFIISFNIFFISWHYCKRDA